MINLVNDPAANAKEICSRYELSGSAMSDSDGNNVRTQIRLKAAQRIEASLRYMMQHLNKPMTVRALSTMAGLSDSSFFAFFKSATGQTPLDFFIRARMQRAGELLSETTMQIKEIAAVLGYDDQFYFSRRFKSVHGISPREYRTRKAESNFRNCNRDTARAKSRTEFNAPYSPRLVPVRENQQSRPMLIGGFPPAATRAQTFEENHHKSSLPPVQTCSVE